MKLLKNGSIVIERDKDCFKELLEWAYYQHGHHKHYLGKWSGPEITRVWVWRIRTSDKRFHRVEEPRPLYRIKKRRKHYQDLVNKFSSLASLYEYLYK